MKTGSFTNLADAWEEICEAHPMVRSIGLFKACFYGGAVAVFVATDNITQEENDPELKAERVKGIFEEARGMVENPDLFGA